MDKLSSMNKKQLMDWIYCLGFCADDMQLYLDTHYEDKDALEYYNQCNNLLIKARNEYEKKYGVLLLSANDYINEWNWNKGKMPWEGDK